MKTLVLILFGVLAQAQTSVKPDQLRAAPAPTLRLVAFDASGRLALLEIGAGIELVGSTLVASASAPPMLVKTRLVRDSAGNYPATTGVVTRNGVVQEEGGDYAIRAPGTLVPALPWDAGDIVLTITAVSVPPAQRIAP